jgi:transcriptional regulator with XRE-family HTH domain
MTFWENVNKMIKRSNTTQEWVAKKSGISPSALRSNVSRGIEPGVLKAIRIAQALDTTVEYLVTGIEPPDKETEYPSQPGSGHSLAMDQSYKYDGTGSTAQEYSQVIDDLKILDSNVRAGFITAIHQTAECVRREKNRQGGSAAG